MKRPSRRGLVGAAAVTVVTTTVLTGVGLAGLWWSGRTAEPVVLVEHVLAPGAAPTAPAVARADGTTGAARSKGRGASVQVDPEWVRDTASRAGIPAPALRAYADATLRLQTERPGCGLGWTTLAGIGYNESQHGTIEGRSLGVDGRSDRPILGPVLDGRGSFAAVPVGTSSHRWFTGSTWDRAVGPLQFLPSTWSTWKADGDGDGRSDPNDLDDAALAAGRYLCADGRRLDDEGWAAGIFSYNHSDEYVRDVYRAAAAYAARSR